MLNHHDEIVYKRKWRGCERLQCALVEGCTGLLLFLTDGVIYAPHREGGRVSTFTAFTHREPPRSADLKHSSSFLLSSEPFPLLWTSNRASGVPIYPLSKSGV